jgi:hypothetical protein
MTTQFDADVWNAWLAGPANVEDFAAACAKVMLQTTSAKISLLQSLVSANNLECPSDNKLGLLQVLAQCALKCFVGNQAVPDEAPGSAPPVEGTPVPPAAPSPAPPVVHSPRRLAKRRAQPQNPAEVPAKPAAHVEEPKFFSDEGEDEDIPNPLPSPTIAPITTEAVAPAVPEEDKGKEKEKETDEGPVGGAATAAGEDLSALPLPEVR